MRILTLAALVLTGCFSPSGYQAGPPGIPENVNAYCNLLGAQNPENDLRVRNQCYQYYALTGQVPTAR